jgi:hypothetical protein
MSTDPPSSALDAGNEVFHEAYSGARDGVKRQVPVLVVLPMELVLHHQNERKSAPCSRATFVRAKSAAHMAVALFALTGNESNSETSRSGLARLHELVSAALDEVGALASEPLDQEIRALLQRCQSFARQAGEKAPSQSLALEFAGDAGPRILRITELATHEQIAALHEAVETTLSTLSSTEQAELQVVVVGDHQARARSLGMQYFKRRLHEEPGADERVTYGENISDEEEALSLVATRRLDKRIAAAFFGDENRLQRDVLGDAAMRCLDQMKFPS